MYGNTAPSPCALVKHKLPERLPPVRANPLWTSLTADDCASAHCWKC